MFHPPPSLTTATTKQDGLEHQHPRGRPIPPGCAPAGIRRRRTRASPPTHRRSAPAGPENPRDRSRSVANRLSRIRHGGSVAVVRLAHSLVRLVDLRWQLRHHSGVVWRNPTTDVGAGPGWTCSARTHRPDNTAERRSLAAGSGLVVAVGTHRVVAGCQVREYSVDGVHVHATHVVLLQ